MLLNKIATDQIDFHSSSCVDPVGKVFSYKGSLYRGIRKEAAPFYKKMFAPTGDSEKLISFGLCPTNTTDLLVDGFELVLQHELLPFVTYPPEWPGELLRRSTIFLCELQLRLLSNNLSLQDGHPWNVLFNGMVPVFVDWGSLGQKNSFEVFYNEIQNWCLFPLFLKSIGFHNAARQFLLGAPEQPLKTPEGEYFRQAKPKSKAGKNKGSKWQRAVRQILRKPVLDTRERTFNEWVRGFDCPKLSPKKVLENTISAVENLPLLSAKTEWANYSGADLTHCYDNPETWNTKTRNVQHYLSKLQPSSVIDVGCNRGWYSELARRSGAKVLALDIDETSLNAFCKTNPSTKISTAHFDLASPANAHGISGAYQESLRRWRADMVLCLAVTHHLVFKRHMSFEKIVESLAKLTNESGTLIVEFIPADDVHVTKWVTPSHKEYTLDAFKEALSKHFGLISIVEAFPNPRVLCVCQQKNHV